MVRNVNLLDKPAILTRCRDRGLSVGENWVRSRWERGDLPSVVINRKRHSREDYVDQLIEGYVRDAS